MMIEQKGIDRIRRSLIKRKPESCSVTRPMGGFFERFIQEGLGSFSGQGYVECTGLQYPGVNGNDNGQYPPGKPPASGNSCLRLIFWGLCGMKK